MTSDAESDDSSAFILAPVVRFEILPSGMAAPIQLRRLPSEDELPTPSNGPPFTASSVSWNFDGEIDGRLTVVNDDEEIEDVRKARRVFRMCFVICCI